MNDSAKIQLYGDYFFRRKQDLEYLQNEFQKNYPRYYDFRYTSDIPKISDLQKSLNPQTIFLQYFQSAENNYLLCIRPNDAQFILLPSSNKIQKQLIELVALIQSSADPSNKPKENFEQFTTLAHSLYQDLLPVELANTTRLIIVANSLLTSFPFEVLLRKKPVDPNNYLDLPYLLHDFAISYQHSATLYLRLRRQKSNSAKELLLAFAPFFQKTSSPADSGINLGPLPFSRNEVRQLERLFPASILLGEQATKAAFIQKAKNHRILHLATHAIADFENPTNSRLAFCPSDTNSGDSFLYYYEVQNLRFSADLVVLSACESGAGKVDRGEGILSLARSFFYAGVPSVLMTKWQINDRSSSLLIAHFYQELKNGLPKDIALQRAKLDFLQNEADPINAHPFYWAGFAQIGNAEALTFSSFPWWLFSLLIPVFLWLVWSYRR